MNNKKYIRRISLIILLSVFLVSVTYILLAEYYKEGFSYGTWINGIYCTGKSAEKVERELLETYSYDGLVIYDDENRAYEVKAEEIDFAFSFNEALHAYLSEQNPYRWAENLFTAIERKLTPVISYNEEKLEAVLGTIPPLAEQAKDAEHKVFIVKTHAGYELVNERVGVLNREKAKQIIAQSLTEAETQVDLKEAGCYEDLPLTPVMKAELARWEKIEDFQDCKIVYQFGEEEYVLKADLVCEWMALDKDGREIYDEAGNILPDDKKIEAFIDALADEYDTVGGTRRFQATRGEIITVKGGTYGNRMDRKAEKEYLKQAFRERRAEVHEPAYLKQGWKQGRDDIGDTYIEVDMTQQMMYYYKGGVKELETPIVTGNTGRRMGTPEGVNFVYGKQKNRVLRGPNYASPVDFWMPVKGNIGIHDASWRSEFGGEIYKTGGSHGCINTPHEAMSRLYDMAEIGTPVVMFY